MKKWGEDGGRELLPLDGFRDRKLFCLSEKILREDSGSRLPVRVHPREDASSARPTIPPDLHFPPQRP